jgi:hypothetical protein
MQSRGQADWQCKYARGIFSPEALIGSESAPGVPVIFLSRSVLGSLVSHENLRPKSAAITQIFPWPNATSFTPRAASIRNRENKTAELDDLEAAIAA